MLLGFMTLPNSAITLESALNIYFISISFGNRTELMIISETLVGKKILNPKIL